MIPDLPRPLKWRGAFSDGLLRDALGDLRKGKRSDLKSSNKYVKVKRHFVTKSRSI